MRHVVVKDQPSENEGELIEYFNNFILNSAAILCVCVCTCDRMCVGGGLLTL